MYTCGVQGFFLSYYEITMALGRPRGGSGYVPRIRVNFRLEPELHKALGKAAKRSKTSQNSYVEEAVRTRLEKDGFLKKQKVG